MIYSSLEEKPMLEQVVIRTVRIRTQVLVSFKIYHMDISNLILSNVYIKTVRQFLKD